MEVLQYIFLAPFCQDIFLEVHVIRCWNHGKYQVEVGTTVKLKLKDIVDVLGMQPQGSRSFLDSKSGEILTIMDEEFDQARSEKPIESFTQWEQGPIAMARDVLENPDRYIQLPNTTTKNEFIIMRHYCGYVKDPVMAEALREAVEGQQNLRQFKEGINKFGLNQDWFRFRNLALQKLARTWCNKYNISIDDGSKR